MQGWKVRQGRHPGAGGVALNSYLGTTGADLVLGHSGSRPMFTATGKPLYRTSAFWIVQRLARLANIEDQISPHSLRHSFATIALDAGVSLHSLQDSMGHADPGTTRRYDWARNNLQKSAGYDFARVLP